MGCLVVRINWIWIAAYGHDESHMNQCIALVGTL